MIKVMQFGEGNFLRAFADLYLDTLNKKGLSDYQVTIIKPAPYGDLKKFEKQNSKYNVFLRGFENGETVEKAYPVSCVNRAIDPFLDFEGYISLAEEEDLKIIISNTTEAGICFSEKDDLGDFLTATYPAKLTQFLYRRYSLGKGGVYILPVELIDDNADTLKRCIDQYISLWNLPKEFKDWNDSQNFYCNTLVDRIVSGYPKDGQTVEKLKSIIGEEDELMTVGEPFGLWVIQDKGDISKYIKQGKHNVEVIITNAVAYYKKRKVRVLNGSHTNLVPAGIISGAVTVYDCMKDDKLSSFVNRVLENEIIPFVSNDVKATKIFADSVIQRFLNPFLNHRLTDVALNSISKWSARNLPSFKDYYSAHGKIAPLLTVGFSYLITLYSMVKKVDGKYVVSLPNRDIELKDNAQYLDYFADNRPIRGFLEDKSVWEEDFTKYGGFIETVIKNVELIRKGICLYE